MVPDGSHRKTDQYTMFYRADFHDADGLTGLRFFDAHELAEAKESALTFVEQGVELCAEVRDDGGRLVFRTSSQVS